MDIAEVKVEQREDEDDNAAENSQVTGPPPVTDPPPEVYMELAEDTKNTNNLEPIKQEPSSPVEDDSQECELVITNARLTTTRSLIKPVVRRRIKMLQKRRKLIRGKKASRFKILKRDTAAEQTNVSYKRRGRQANKVQFVKNETHESSGRVDFKAGAGRQRKKSVKKANPGVSTKPLGWVKLKVKLDGTYAPVSDTDTESSDRETATSDRDASTLDKSSTPSDECKYRVYSNKATETSDQDDDSSVNDSKSSNNYECPVCNLNSLTEKQLDQHVTTSRCMTDIKAHMCNFCPQGFATFKELKAHESEKHINETFLCEKCGKNFMQRNSLLQHYNSVHDTSKIYACTFEGCSKIFNNVSNKKKHFDSVHLNLRKHPCDECSMAFKTTGALKVHKYTRHTAESEKQVFECQVCDKTFYSKVHKDQHEKLHSNEKPHACTFEGCGKQFRDKSNLLKHIRVHDNIKPYVCEECGEAFSRRVYLVTHQYKHTGKKMYPCKECNKSFTQRGNLKAHMILHSQERAVFTCSKCDRTFNHKSNYTKHLRNHDDPQYNFGTKRRRVMHSSELAHHLNFDDDYNMMDDYKEIIDDEKRSDRGNLKNQKEAFIIDNDAMTSTILMRNSQATTNRKPLLIIRHKIVPPKLQQSNVKDEETVNTLVVTQEAATQHEESLADNQTVVMVTEAAQVKREENHGPVPVNIVRSVPNSSGSVELHIKRATGPEQTAEASVSSKTEAGESAMLAAQPRDSQTLSIPVSNARLAPNNGEIQIIQMVDSTTQQVVANSNAAVTPGNTFQASNHGNIQILQAIDTSNQKVVANRNIPATQGNNFPASNPGELHVQMIRTGGTSSQQVVAKRNTTTAIQGQGSCSNTVGNNFHTFNHGNKHMIQTVDTSTNTGDEHIIQAVATSNHHIVSNRNTTATQGSGSIAVGNNFPPTNHGDVQIIQAVATNNPQVITTGNTSATLAVLQAVDANSLVNTSSHTATSIPEVVIQAVEATSNSVATSGNTGGVQIIQAVDTSNLQSVSNSNTTATQGLSCSVAVGNNFPASNHGDKQIIHSINNTAATEEVVIHDIDANIIHTSNNPAPSAPAVSTTTTTQFLNSDIEILQEVETAVIEATGGDVHSSQATEVAMIPMGAQTVKVFVVGDDRAHEVEADVLKEFLEKCTRSTTSTELVPMVTEVPGQVAGDEEAGHVTDQVMGGVVEEVAEETVIGINVEVQHSSEASSSG